jgi:hypothetical protein
MHKSGLLLVAVVFIIALAACNTGGEPELPTLASIDDGDTPALAPTETATEQTSDDPTPTAESVIRERPTLPPTWTPLASTSTPEPTPAQPTNVPTPIEERSEACDRFVVDRANSAQSIRVGDSPTVAWTRLDTPELRLYHLTVVDEAGEERYQRLVEDTSHTIPAEVFTDAVLYGWEVLPLDELGQPICASRGGLLDARD